MSELIIESSENSDKITPNEQPIVTVRQRGKATKAKEPKEAKPIDFSKQFTPGTLRSFCNAVFSKLGITFISKECKNVIDLSTNSEVTALRSAMEANIPTVAVKESVYTPYAHTVLSFLADCKKRKRMSADVEREDFPRLVETFGMKPFEKVTADAVKKAYVAELSDVRRVMQKCVNNAFSSYFTTKYPKANDVCKRFVQRVPGDVLEIMAEKLKLFKSNGDHMRTLITNSIKRAFERFTPKARAFNKALGQDSIEKVILKADSHIKGKTSAQLKRQFPEAVATSKAEASDLDNFIEVYREVSLAKKFIEHINQINDEAVYVKGMSDIERLSGESHSSAEAMKTLDESDEWRCILSAIYIAMQLQHDHFGKELRDALSDSLGMLRKNGISISFNTNARKAIIAAIENGTFNAVRFADAHPEIYESISVPTIYNPFSMNVYAKIGSIIYHNWTNPKRVPKQVKLAAGVAVVMQIRNHVQAFNGKHVKVHLRI